MNEAHLPKLLWLWLPLAFMVVQLVIESVLSPQTLSILQSEGGPHEVLEALIIGAAFIVAAATLIRFPVREKPWMAGWIGLAALCCFYVAGEEISWGQHLFHWTTPEFWQGINDQHETNLHNASSWLDQKPRILLEIGVLTGGIVIPLLRHYRPSLLPQRFAAIYPPSYLAVTAGLALAVKVADTLAGVMHITLFERGSEVQELYLFWFVLLYLVSLSRRPV